MIKLFSKVVIIFNIIEIKLMFCFFFNEIYCVMILSLFVDVLYFKVLFILIFMNILFKMVVVKVWDLFDNLILIDGINFNMVV